jgi:hypothetical protein
MCKQSIDGAHRLVMREVVDHFVDVRRDDIQRKQEGRGELRARLREPLGDARLEEVVLEEIALPLRDLLRLVAPLRSYTIG